MAVKGSREGISRCNKLVKKVEPLIDVKKLKETYLFGITIKDRVTGKELPDSVFQQYIDNAVSMIEHDLDISIVPHDEVEYRDFHFNEYWDWGYFQLNNFPVIEVTSLDLVYFKSTDQDGDGEPDDETTEHIPDQWLRVQGHDGIIRLIPNARFPGNLQVDGNGAFLPYLLRSSMVPHAWKITYKHGFDDGQIPVIINHAIGLSAAIQALIVGGNLVLGAGIASSSLSIDGLSQAINTTQSAENSAYSATIKEYQTVLVGRNEIERQNSIMEKLRAYYKGETFGML